MVEAFEREKLKVKIRNQLMNPYAMQLTDKKDLGLNFASTIEDIPKFLNDCLNTIRPATQQFVKDTVAKNVFVDFVKKLFRYTDEIYYIEKRRKVLSEDKLKPKLLDIEIKRLQNKTKELARAYATLIYGTTELSRKKNYWEGLLAYQTFVVKKGYSEEKSEDIVNDLVDETNRLMRTSAFNCQLRGRIYEEEQENFRDNVKNGAQGKEKLDGMISMLEYRKKINTNINGDFAKYHKRTDYRPLVIKQTPLKSVNTNSTLLSTQLPVVKDKKVVQYRIQNRTRKFTKIGVDRERVMSMIESDIKKLKEMNDISCDF